MEKARIKPTEGRIVIDPKTGRQLPAGGAIVRMGTFWGRRLRDGDVTAEAIGEKKKPASSGGSSSGGSKS